jgi:hypothetical protein
MNIMWIRASALVILALLIGCAKESGKFAMRNVESGAYQTMQDGAEYSANTPFEWIYAFPPVKDQMRVGIVLQKQELAWVDVSKDETVVTKSSPFYYGTTAPLDEGTYRLVILELRKTEIVPIAETGFRIVNYSE